MQSVITVTTTAVLAVTQLFAKFIFQQDSVLFFPDINISQGSVATTLRHKTSFGNLREMRLSQ